MGLGEETMKYDDVHRMVENEMNSNNIHDLLIGVNGKKIVNQYDPQDSPNRLCNSIENYTQCIF